MKKIFILPAILFTTVLSAQKVVNVDNSNSNLNPSNNIYGNFYTVSGVPFNAAKYVRIVSGSGYLSDNWMKADLILGDNKVCNNAIVRLDLLDNSVEYMDVSGNKMIATSVIREIKMTDTTNGDQYRFVHSSTLPTGKGIQEGWYEVLEEGKASVYKRINKSVSESRQTYGSATMEQSIHTTEEYYIVNAGIINRIKKFNSIPDVLLTKKEELKKFIKEKGLDGKTQDDFTTVVAYYNELLKAS